MVGRLVEKQHIGRHRQRPRQGRALLLPARERTDQRVRVQRKAPDHPFGLRFERPGIAHFQFALQSVQTLTQHRLVGGRLGHGLRCRVVLREQIRNLAHAHHHGLEDRKRRIERRLLGYVAQANPRHPPDRPVVQRTLPGQSAQQRRLATTVTPDQGHPLARIDLELGTIKQRHMAVSQRGSGENQMGHRRRVPEQQKGE